MFNFGEKIDINIIKNLYIFSDANEDLIYKIYKKGKVINVKAKTKIINEGDIANEAYILIKGILNVYIGGKKVNIIFPGDIFGEIGLVMNEKRTATIETEIDSKVLKITKDSLTDIIKNIPNGDFIKKTILSRILENKNRK